ncbi:MULTISPECIES: ABC transporter permease/substrate-binding protein [Chryseobacterium]|uniref:ABC transporter permease/substrate-binding protein n=1 Tax=Chryseobacterium TaxID=59732 RepID=UPI00195AC306|nr:MULTISPECIES: ABC transporter permease/substrate-binding protein [Chryseobacterium]MBM7420542.1 osmoprotectant transport system permease protein [Chryseobacterium sp. JUb44]MDH6210492.1 osmoprotectant transport system permease protein [Chryseobacterium sp. BIGb0186]WSO09186.1 ABC transporter permease/substrate-binding protein [Chryseobacterium scophthalmum]
MSTQSFWQFIVEQHEKLMGQVIQHLGLTFLSLFLAILIGLPLGILIARKRKLSNPVLGIAGILQTIPSIALLGFMIPAFGIGATPAIVALIIYALLPIIRNTYTGITEVNPTVIEAAKAMGMNRKQLLFKVELPLAMPVIIAGIRTAAVINVGVATLASFVAAGGLGEFIFGGISLNNTNMILAGAIPAALLAILLDQIIAVLQKSGYQLFKKLKFIVPVLLLSIGIIYLSKSVSDTNKLKAGFTPEFMGRQDGDLGLRSVYGLNVHPVVVSDAVMYKAAFEKELDLISGYSTDGRIKAFDLYVLEDDKKIFPPYFAAPIIKMKTLEKFPELEKTLNLLSAKFNDSVMTDLNFKSDYLNQTPEKIAKDFLIKTNLYKNPRKGNSQTIKIGSKIFGEQYILAEIYKMLIEGYTDYKVETKTGLGGTKICFDALMNDAIDFYPEYTGTGLLVLLKPSEKTIKEVSESPEKTFDYVNSEFQKQYGIEWLKPLGFNNSYALMMRRKQAEELNIKYISDLKNYLDSK